MKFDKRSITSFDIQKLTYKSEVDQLREDHGYLFDPLSQKHPHLFDPLIAAYKSSKPDGKVRQRLGEMIVELLGFAGDVIQMHIDDYEPLHIATHYGVTEDEVNSILVKFNQRNITSFDIQKVIYKSEVNQLRERYDYLFDPLIDLCLNTPRTDKDKYYEIERLFRNLVDETSRHAVVIQLHNEGFNGQDIGNKYGVSRERIRQIIKKYQGYYIVSGSKEWVLKELEKLKWVLKELEKLTGKQDDKRVFPSNEELDNYHPKLVGSLKEHFTTSKKFGELTQEDRYEIIRFFGFNLEEEIKSQKKWTLERVIYEVKEVAKQIGKPDLMPMQKDFLDLGLQNLRGAIARFGGQFKVAELAGLNYQGPKVGEDGGKIYWTDERIRNFLHDVAEKEGHPEYMPTQQECAKYYDKGGAIINIFTNSAHRNRQTLTWFEVAQKYGLKFNADYHRITLSYIKSFVKGLGDSLYNLTPSEIYVLFEQQGINKAGINTFRDRTFDTLIEAIQSGNLPHEEIDKWINDKPAQIVDALLDPENKTVEEAFRKVDKRLNKTDHKTKTENPSDENYQEDIEQDLPAPNAGDTLKSLSVTTNILVNGSSDQEAINFLVAKAKAKLWKRCFEDEQAAIAEAQEHTGNVYSEAVRDSFIEEYTRCKQLPIPQGYSFKDDSGTFREPKLMQRLIAYRLLQEGRVLNLSGTGTGKTLSAVLASRVVGAQITVIACPNSTIKGWKKTIKNSFPNPDVVTKSWNPIWSNNDSPRYLVINHEMFQNRYLSDIKKFIRFHAIDFIVIDELHQVKQRDAKEESQRRHLLNGLITDIPNDRPKPRVLGMSATPIINNLQEGKSLVELVSSLSQDDIGTSVTVPNCMKLYQKFTTMGFRMIPQHQQSRIPTVHPIDATPYLEDLFALGHRPHPQQVEAVLVKARWSAIKQHLRPKTVVFTEYVKDIVPYLARQIKQTTPFSVGTYTGNDKDATEEGFVDMLEQFLKGKVDILVASIKCLGTGVDGLQYISNNVIFASLPWTSTDYEQAIGRFDREGFVFDSLDIHVPKTYALLSNGEEWSWCQSKLNRLENKRDIAKAAVDGEIPDSNSQLTPAKATQYWMGWLRRISEEGLNEIERREIKVPLDEADEVETSRRYASYGDFSTLNARWNNAHSSTTNERLRNNPEEWCFYHTRMDEIETNWQLNPREECIKHLKLNLPAGSVIGDFGCGQAKLAEALKEIHTVHSFDHIAINRNVIACDMSHTPLNDDTLDASIFSLSLMGTNIKDYILEAYRTLKLGGQLLIYHPAEKHDRIKFTSGLTKLGFAIVKSVEVYKWHYIWAIKQGKQENINVTIEF
ncbi:MAG: DEAD/DEAH box helicase [Pseudanabaena sp. M007S1SP1A06QC]|nr:DEAD/DEAH box helicase [Pseudanabaena sp. M007S1SP1A06QC]